MVSDATTLILSDDAQQPVRLSFGARVNWMTGLRGGDHHGRVDLDAFVRGGYVAIPGAVDAGTVAACRELTWTAMERRGVGRDDPGGWPPLVEGMDDLHA